MRKLDIVIEVLVSVFFVVALLFIILVMVGAMTFGIMAVVSHL